jgi:hypothetical protein
MNGGEPERAYSFFRCPNGTVAFDAVFAGGAMYQLDQHGMCPLCGTPVAEHESFTLRARPTAFPGEEAA